MKLQLVEKDPEAAIALFWEAINVGDRVDSALKDMAVVMKQQNRVEEAIEAIKSFRDRCSKQAQESLDNVLMDLYKVRTHSVTNDQLKKSCLSCYINSKQTFSLKWDGAGSVGLVAFK